MDGILPLWKPKGMTSHDCIYKIRKLIKMKKVGHTGTLDPEVEGVLPICLGQATKISSIVMETKKVYEAELTLGVATETEDQEGNVVETKAVEKQISVSEIQQVLQTFIGEINQVPPMYSAVKVNGKKLYEYARKGIQIDRPSRVVTIHDLKLLSEPFLNDNQTTSFRIEVTASKGTYVRTLCVDIGKALGFPAHMSHLVRTESGSFSGRDTISFDELEKAVENNTLSEHVISIDKALSRYDTLTIRNEEKDKFINGRVLPLPQQKLKTNPFRVKTETDELIALYQLHPTKPTMIKPFKMFVKNG